MTSKTSKRSRAGSGGKLGVTSPRGFVAAGGTCGIKASGNPDLTLIVADRPCSAAAVYTVNRMPSAPVVVGRRHLRSGVARAIICNSGNANASTGKQGERDAVEMCRLVAQHIGCDAREVIPSSTGIIGHVLPMEKIGRGIASLCGRLSRGKSADAAAARGIMTTDLVPKTASATLRLGGRSVTLAGIAKGSGMIAPNMATMLAFLTTDAAIAPAMLKAALQRAAAKSFNRISVDQHTSPSDTCAILASGAAGNAIISKPGPDLERFEEALTTLCADLAYQIVKDGEGATKVFVVRVVGAASEKDADRAGRAVVDSPLVKCAVHGGDPNWGRITTAAGYSRARVRPQNMSLFIGPDRDVCVFDHGSPLPRDPRTSKQLQKLMAAKEIVFTLDLGLGRHEARWLGCDLSRQYVAINADYST
jgi:glutamate N-acetyltransferase/amino-acid N-acetyltransferase